MIATRIPSTAAKLRRRVVAALVATAAIAIPGCGGSSPSAGPTTVAAPAPIAADETPIFEADDFLARFSPWGLPGDPDVVDIGGTWTMFFTANQLATQLNGRAQVHVLAARLAPGEALDAPASHWTVLTAGDGTVQPVISPNPDPDAWDGWAIETPDHVHGYDATRGAWVDRIYYTGWRSTPPDVPWDVAIGFAEWDGNGFAKHGDPVVLPTQPFERFGAGHQLGDQAVLYVAGPGGAPGTWHLYYHATTDAPELRIQIVHARSVDGVVWPADQREVLDATPPMPEAILPGGPYDADCIADGGEFLQVGFMPGAGSRDGLYLRSWIGPPANGGAPGRWTPLLLDLVGPAWRTAGLAPRPVGGGHGDVGLLGSTLATDGGPWWLFYTGFRIDGAQHKPSIGRARIDRARVPAAIAADG